MIMMLTQSERQRILWMYDISDIVTSNASSESESWSYRVNDENRVIRMLGEGYLVIALLRQMRLNLAL